MGADTLGQRQGTSLVAGAVVGWRFWMLTNQSAAPAGGCMCPACSTVFGGTAPERVRLRAAANDTVWPSKRPLRAVCGRRVDHDDIDAPDADCHCGIYAWRAKAELVNGLWQSTSLGQEAVIGGWVVCGSVDLWGRVVSQELGYRAEYARPTSLLRLWRPDVDDMATVIAERYGIPIVDDEPLRWALADRYRDAVEAQQRRDEEQAREDAAAVEAAKRAAAQIEAQIDADVRRLASQINTRAAVSVRMPNGEYRTIGQATNVRISQPPEPPKPSRLRWLGGRSRTGRG